MATSAGLVFVFVLLLSNGGECFDFGFGDITELLKIIKDVGFDTLKVYDIVYTMQHDEKIEFPLVRRFEKEIINYINTVSRKIDVYDNKYEDRNNLVLDAIVTKLPEKLMLDRNMNDLWKYINQIENAYRNFVRYSLTPSKYEQYTLEDFAKNTLSSNLNAIPNILETIHQLVVPTGWTESIYNKSILYLLAKHIKTFKNSQTVAYHQFF